MAEMGHEEQFPPPRLRDRRGSRSAATPVRTLLFIGTALLPTLRWSGLDSNL